MSALDAVVTALVVVLLVPVLVFVAECVFALAPWSPRCRLPSSARRPRTAILVPAREEEAVIGDTLRALLPELAPGDALLVVADDCSDRTAEIARACGADVILRNEPGRRGKGHAIAFGLRHLELDPPDVVVVIDADCSVAQGSIETLARHAAGAGRPIQAEYVLIPADPSSPAALSAVAFSLRNRVRIAGLRAAGLPCPLTGSGMAFPFELLRRAPVDASHIVEDLHLGLDLVLLGTPPASCPEAHVTGKLPTCEGARRTQRRRWEHGHLDACRARLPGLLWVGISRGRATLIGMALDLAVPPLSLLVLLLGAATVAGAAMLAASGSGAPIALALFGLLLVGLAVAASLPAACRGVARLPVLLGAPRYLATKLPLYLDLLRRGPERRWLRTPRAMDEDLARKDLATQRRHSLPVP